MDALKTTLSKFKNVIIGALVVVGLMFAYNIFVLQPKKAENAGSLRSENKNAVSTEIGREIVATLNRLKSLNIDPEFFQEDAFVQLIDFSVDLEDKEIGKQNPFKDTGAADAQFVSQEVEGAEVFENVEEITSEVQN